MVLRRQFGSRTLTASAGSDVFLCKMSANGDVTWVKRAGGAGHDQALGVAVTPNGDRVYAVGIFNGSADFGDGKPIEAFSQGQDLFVWALTANGDFSFAKRIGTSKNEDHIACFADASGKLLATGAMMGTTVFDNKTLTASSDLYSDVFLCRFEKTGGIDLLKRYGGIYNEVGKAVYVDSRNMIYITGHFDTIATFGGTTVNSNGGRDMFITRLWPNGDVEWVRSGGGEFDDEGTGIAVSSTGVPYVSGTFDTEAYFDGYYVKGDKFTDAFVAAMVCGPNTDIMLNAAELTICEGVDTLLQAQTGYIGYTWKVNGVDVSQAGGGAGFNMGSLTPGKHNVTVEITDVYGCKGTSKTVAVEVLPAPPKPVITRLDNVLGCSIPDMQYQWYLNGVIVAGATSQTMEVRGDGYYRVKVTGDNGCSSWSDNFIIGPSSVPGISGHGVQVWPNPFTDAIEVKGAIGREIIITDMLGREVMRSTAVTDSETVRVVGSVGSYMLIVRNGGEVWTTMVQKR